MANGNQFGSFGNLPGVSPEGFSAIKRAIERRQGGGSSPALNQQSLASATPATPQSSVPAGATGGTRLPQRQAGGTPATTNKVPFPDPENELILRAMGDFLKSKTKIAQAQVGIQ